MTPTIWIASVVTATLGSGLAVQSIAERRRALRSKRITDAVAVGRGMPSRLAPAATPQHPLSRLVRDRSIPRSLMTPLANALAAAGDVVTPRHLLIVGAIVGLVLVTASWFLDLPWFIAAPVALAAAAAAPLLLIQKAQQRFQERFLRSFPDALDLIVRAIRAGLPLADAVENVGKEIAAPVGSLFSQIHSRTLIGLDLEQELDAAATRLRIVEFRFFAIALSLQRRTGGNLAETLEKLSAVIRRRKELRQRARALTAETRASAWTIGVLPFLSMASLYFLNRSYLTLLFTDPRGHFILTAAIVGLGSGVLVMRAMITGSLR